MGVMALKLDAHFLILFERCTECPASYPGFTSEQDTQRLSCPSVVTYGYSYPWSLALF